MQSQPVSVPFLSQARLTRLTF
jgi:hypothetical protein